MAPTQAFFADLHVHLGRAAGRPVKIAASAALDLPGILRTARADKGLDLVGIIDGATSGGLADLEDAVRAGRLRPLPGGGLVAADGLVVLPGAEVELRVCGHRVHFICLVPGLTQARTLLAALARHIKNPSLSSQLAHGLDPDGLLEIVAVAGGILWPAHAFTPHRGLYGCALRRAGDAPPAGLGPAYPQRFAAIELGLSADTDMADRCSELAGNVFVSNSDAHSLPTLARECNRLRCAGPPDYGELVRCLTASDGRAVTDNYGLEPALGKYHRTVCLRCQHQAAGPPPVHRCPACGSEKVVLGVADRLAEIADRPEPVHPAGRPPYRPQVPLRMLPGVGPRTAGRLAAAIGPELVVLHLADLADIARVAGEPTAAAIGLARRGALRLRPGGGGRYGAVETEQ